MPHTGQCLCGAVRFTADAEPLGSRMCWCADCQKIACGSGTVNVLFPDGAVTYQGEVTAALKTADSGNEIERGFCPKCGSHLYARNVGGGGPPFRVRAGTLDNPDLMAPQAIIWTSSAPAWARFDPDLPQYPKAP